MLNKFFPSDRWWHPFLVLMAWVILFTLFAQVVLLGLGRLTGLNLTSFDVSDPVSLTIQIFVQHLFVFILPGLLTLYVFPALRPEGTFSMSDVYLTVFWKVILMFLFGLPLVGFLNWINMQLPLPEDLMQVEDNVNEILKSLLGSGSFLRAIFLIGLVPAIGEELVFRGVIQKGLENATGRPHLAVLLAGILFSLIHFQFAGFLPRMFLGMLLGYAYYFTGSLWVPMMIHFLFNSIQAVAMLMKPDMIEQIGDVRHMEMPPLWVVLAALIGLVWVFRSLVAGATPRRDLP